MEPIAVATLILLPLLAAALALGIFLLVRQLLRAAAGWPALLACFSCDRPPTGRLWVRQTLAVGSMRWRKAGCLVISPHGLYLRGGVLGQAILVPWTAVAVGRDTRLYGKPATELTLGSPQVGCLTVAPELCREMRAYLTAGGPHTEVAETARTQAAKAKA